MAMDGGKYNILLAMKHGLYPHKLELNEWWHDRMYMATKGTYTRLSYNTHNNDNVTWNQYGGTGVTLTVNIKSQIYSKWADPSKLGRWTWARINGKAVKATVSSSSAYQLCKNVKGLSTVWNQ